MMTFLVLLLIFRCQSISTEEEVPVFMKEMELISSLLGHCPYCDPNYMDVPNLQSAMKGYDLPMGDPNRAGIQDPGIRSQIFSPMKSNDLGFMEVDGTFITVNENVKCDSAWKEDIHHNLKSYIKGKVKHSFIGMSSDIGKDLEIPYKPTLASPVTINIKLPTLFRRGSASDDEIERIHKFLVKDRGSIAISQAICSTHRVDISQRSGKRFTEPFLEAIRGLYLASNKSDLEQKFELKRFIDEFGTHYASKTILGVKLLAERRYSFKERSTNEDNNLKRCNTAAGVKLIGLQIDPDNEKCLSPNLLSDHFHHYDIQRTHVTTYGSYASSNSSDWSEQIANLQAEGALNPIPIKRKLIPIFDLLWDKSIQSLTFEDGSKINVTRIEEWVFPNMATYCELSGIQCSKFKPHKCGYDDNCHKDEWCEDNEHSYTCNFK